MVLSIKIKFAFCFLLSLGIHFLSLQELNVSTSKKDASSRMSVVLSEAKQFIPNNIPAQIDRQNSPEKTSTVRTYTRVQEDFASNPFSKDTYQSPDPTEVDVLLSGVVLIENFYSTSEVDTPATPENDWPVIVAEGLYKDAYVQAVVSVWINSQGRIERVEVNEMQPESERVKEGLLAMVGAMVRPAMLKGIAVANQRTMQMWLAR
jgi:hypothetical protein